jgi:hypothetical protein
MYAKLEDSEIEVYAEPEDKCYLCQNVLLCPLLSAIQNEAVFLHYENLEIEKCGMFISKEDLAEEIYLY